VVDNRFSAEDPTNLSVAICEELTPVLNSTLAPGEVRSVDLDAGEYTLRFVDGTFSGGMADCSASIYEFSPVYVDETTVTINDGLTSEVIISPNPNSTPSPDFPAVSINRPIQSGVEVVIGEGVTELCIWSDDQNSTLYSQNESPITDLVSGEYFFSYPIDGTCVLEVEGFIAGLSDGASYEVVNYPGYGEDALLVDINSSILTQEPEPEELVYQEEPTAEESTKEPANLITIRTGGYGYES
jgi:hypothetical protein